MELDNSSSYDDCSMNYVQINKQPFSIKISRKDGLLVQIHHTITNNGNSRKKCLRFVNATFNDTSEQIAASDQAGNIFIIDLLSLKYWMLPTFGYCSAISYSTYKKNELLIGKDDGTIEIINTETGGITGRLINHKLPVKWISYASGQPFCLTATNDEAFIWDLQTSNRIHRLTLHTTIKLKLVKFIPVSNNILACFADDTIQIWEYETGRSVLKISPEQWNNHQLNSVAFSKNGRILVVGGQTSKIFVICLKRITIKTFNLPKKNVVTKILDFLPRLFDAGENKILLVLTNNFTEYFVDIESGNIIQTISVNDINVDTFFFSENGKYTMYILNTGELNVYLTEKLFPSLSKFYPIEGQQQRQNGKKRYPGCDREKYHKTCTVSDTQVTIVKPKTTGSTLKSREISNQQLNEIQNKISCVLNIGRLKSVLKEFGEYPENYRLLIWKNILKLPNNKLAYDALVNKGNHVVCESIENCYPLKNQSLLNSLKRLISCLCHWSPLFSQVHYLPLFVFPFVKIFRNDPLVCFEAVATIIVNWCQRWFEFFPFPPINILSLAENILCEWDEELLLWFTEHQVTSHLYAWTLLQTGFSEVLNTQEWLQLFDNILSNDPTYYIFAVVGYNIMCRSALLNLTDLSDFDLFYHSPTAIDMKRFINKINQMYSETKEENHPRKYMKILTPLVKGDTYQVFNDYPKFMIDRQAEQVNAMKVEELELLKEQTRLTEARKEQEKEHEKALRKQIQNSHLRDLESKYKDALQEEEERLAEHRHKVSNMKRELRKREKQLLEDTREQILQQNADKRKTELSALLNDIDRKRVLQEMEMKDVEEELGEQYEDLLNQKRQLQFQLGLYDNTKSYPPPEHKILQQQQKCLSEEIRKLRQEVSSVHRDRRKEISDRLTAAEDLLQTVETQLAEELAERQTSLCAGQKNIEVLELEAKTCSLKKDVEKLLNALVKRRLQESKDKEKILRECRMDRKALMNEQSDLVQLFPSGNGTSSSCQQWAECDSSYMTDDNLPVTSSFEPSSPTSVYSTEPQSGFITENSNSNNGIRTKKKGPADCSRVTNTNHCSNYFPNSNNNCDFLYRSNDFYLKEQEAIKSSMDLRHKLLHNRK